MEFNYLNCRAQDTHLDRGVGEVRTGGVDFKAPFTSILKLLSH